MTTIDQTDDIRRINLRAPRRLYNQLDLVAKLDERSLNTIILECTARYVKERMAQPGFSDKLKQFIADAVDAGSSEELPD